MKYENNLLFWTCVLNFIRTIMAKFSNEDEIKIKDGDEKKFNGIMGEFFDTNDIELKAQFSATKTRFNTNPMKYYEKIKNNVRKLEEMEKRTNDKIKPIHQALY